MNVLDAVNGLHGGDSRHVLAGLNAEFVYRPECLTERNQAVVSNDETEAKSGAHYWRIGNFRLASSRRQRFPEGPYIESDGVRHRMTISRGKGEGPGLRWFTADNVRLKKGVNIIRVNDNFDGKGEIRLIEVEGNGKGGMPARVY